MASRQLSLIPVSPQERVRAGDELEKLLQQVDDEHEAFDETKKAHRETIATLNKGIGERRAIIRRARLEAEEGLMRQQLDAVFNHDEERRE